MSHNIDWHHKGPSSKYEGTKWLGKHLKGDDERVELRRSFVYRHPDWSPTRGSYYAQVLIVVQTSDHFSPEVLISMNGRAPMTINDVTVMETVVAEAKTYLAEYKEWADE